MSFAGFPSEGGKRAWEEDLPTTVGRVAFSSLKDKAREMMVKGAEKRGLDWTGIVESLQVRQIYAVGVAFGIDIGYLLFQIVCISCSSPSVFPCAVAGSSLAKFSWVTVWFVSVAWV